MDFFDFDAGMFDSFFGDFFGGAGGHAFDDVLAESIFSHAGGGVRFWEALNLGSDVAFDYILYRDAFGHRQSYQDFERAFKAGSTELGSVEVLKGHAFLKQQLRTLQSHEGMAALLNEYQALGAHLPSEELATKIHRALAKHLHPDHSKIQEAEGLMKQLNAAKDALLNPTHREAYEQALRKNPEGIAKHLEELCKGTWKEAAASAMRGAQKRIGSLVGTPERGMSKWFSELTPNARGVVIFSAIASVGVGAYMLAKAMEKKTPKDDGKERAINHGSHAKLAMR